MRFNLVSPVFVGLAFMFGAGLAQAGDEVVAPMAVQTASTPDEDPGLLLKRMAAAMQTTNYEGLLLHMRNGEAHSLRVFHRYDAEHGEREHVLSLDGKPFEVIQDSKGCTCVWPQSRHVVIGHAPAFKARLSTERFAETGSLSAFYTITRQRQARVGGIACRLVKLEPKDTYRFAYRLCIHETSAILLSLEVFDAEHRLEFNQFTQLRVNSENDANDMTLFTNVEGFRVVEDKREAPGEAPPAPFLTSWVATQLPPGYVLRSAEPRIHPSSLKPMEHMIFSDGLGSVSVFIERRESAGQEGSPPESAKPHPRGVMQRVVRDVDGYRLTAVGEAPGAAMRMLLDGMQPATPRAKD